MFIGTKLLTCHVPLHRDLIGHTELGRPSVWLPSTPLCLSCVSGNKVGQRLSELLSLLYMAQAVRTAVLREHAGALRTTAVTPPGSETGSGGEKIGGGEGGTQVPGFAEQGSFLAHWFH